MQKEKNQRKDRFCCSRSTENFNGILTIDLERGFGENVMRGKMVLTEVTLQTKFYVDLCCQIKFEYITNRTKMGHKVYDAWRRHLDLEWPLVTQIL